MKFNWGTGITIAIIAFMSFILFMVIQAINTNADLYAEDYYDQEIKFQNKINARTNYLKIKDELVLLQNDTSVTVKFPSFFEGKTIAGTIYFYRANNADFDQEYLITRENNQQEITTKKLVTGRYSVKISWKTNDTPYYYEKLIIVN